MNLYNPIYKKLNQKSKKKQKKSMHSFFDKWPKNKQIKKNWRCRELWQLKMVKIDITIQFMVYFDEMSGRNWDHRYKGKKNVEAVRSEQSENPRYKYKAENWGEEDKNKKKKKNKTK